MAQTAYTLPTDSRTGHHRILKLLAKVSITKKRETLHDGSFLDSEVS